MDSDQPNWKSGDITFPYYLDDLTQTTPDSKYQSGVEESAIPSPAGAWLGTGLDCTMECEGRNGCPPNVDPNEYGQCPYIVYGGASMSYRHVGNLCEVQELTLQGRGKTPHPIHIHVNHFQVDFKKLSIFLLHELSFFWILIYLFFFLDFWITKN